MKFTIRMGLVGVGLLALAACGDSKDASDEVVAEDVEIVADDAMSDVDAEPVEDDSLATPEPMPEPAPAETSSFEERQAAEREKMESDADAAEKAAADIKAELDKMNEN
tara:strand:- start:40 stop:366 length:327 start_codon:yes stop_codon:yes gene_type:complete